MNGGQVGLIGGIVGGVLGLMGGLVGTYASVKNTKGPRERAYVVRMAILCWVGVTTLLVALSLVPFPWQPLVWLAYLPSLFWFVRRANRGQIEARVEDARETEL